MAKLSLSVAAVALFVFTATSQAIVFNVNTAFVDNEKPDGSEVNPFGPYTYGYSLTPTSPGAFSTAGLVHTDSFAGAGNPEVEGYFIPNSASVPAILANVSALPLVTTFGVPLLPTEILLHPGGLGGDAFAGPIASGVLRFTTPGEGTYDIVGSFNNIGAGATDVHVRINGVSFFSGVDAGAFSILNQNLAPGTAIDFVVGSFNGDIGADSTGLFATINFTPAIPEPATLSLLGLSSLLVFRRRRCR